MAGLRYRSFETPVGRLALLRHPAGRLETRWLAEGEAPAGATPDPDLLPDLAGRLAALLDGRPARFDDVPTPDGPPFQRRCWDACRTIERGQVRTYAELAVRAGSTPGAARAAGQAMRRNPLPVIVPCHRVVGGAGDLHGYAGSRDPDGPELAIKRFLLRVEGAAALASGALH